MGLSSICLLLLIVGLFKPRWVILWGRNKTQKQVWLYYGIATIVCFVLSLPLAQQTRLKQEIYWKLFEIGDRAEREAEREYPTFIGMDLDYIKKQTGLQNTLREQYEKELVQSYGLTYKQLIDIKVEGMKYNWPYPPVK